jgi:hypothetical protein
MSRDRFVYLVSTEFSGDVPDYSVYGSVARAAKFLAEKAAQLVSPSMKDGVEIAKAIRKDGAVMITDADDADTYLHANLKRVL